MKNICLDIIPCWYELSWDAKKTAIILRVHDDFIAQQTPISPDAPLVKSYMNEFGFKSFSFSLSGDFGYDRAFKHVGARDGFREFLIKIPAVKKATGHICPDCQGKGKDPFSPQFECFHCNGKGKVQRYDWQKAYAISATFSVFTRYAGFLDFETTCSKPQLLTLETVTIKDMHGGSLGGEYSQTLVRWLAKLEPDTVITAMTAAMRSAYGKMLGHNKFNNIYFFAKMAYRGGWLNVSCPGDACGLHPAHDSTYEMERGLGYKYSCHNVDNPVQQLTLIAGLAALHDEVRKETKCSHDR